MKKKKELKIEDYLDGWGRPWKYAHVPKYINELNENPIGIEYEKNGYWVARALRIKGGDFKIDVLYEIDEKGKFRMFTDDLKYGPRQEIIFDNDKQCYTIKNLDKLRIEWRQNHPKVDVLDGTFEEFVVEE